MAVSRIFAAAVLAAALSACAGPRLDLTRTLQLTDVLTGWYDAGVVEGTKNKLVPSISFRVKNVGASFDGSVQFNAIFRRTGEQEQLGSAFVRGVDPKGLDAGASSPAIVLRSDFGYTGTEPRGQMLENRFFIDANVELFGKHGSAQWAKLGQFKIDRQLLTK